MRHSPAALLAAALLALAATFVPPLFAGGGGLFQQGINALALSGQTLYVGGDFAKAGTLSRTGLAAVDAADGHLLGFDPAVSLSGGGATVDALAVDAGGLIYAGGEFDHAGGGARENLALLSASGQLLSGIGGAEPDGPVHVLAIQGPDLYAGGEFSSLGASVGGSLRRYSLPADQPDPSWLPGANGTVRALATTATTVYAAGGFTHIGKGAGAARPGLAAVTTSDASATAWNPAPAGTLNGSGSTHVSSMLAAGATVYVGGSFTTLGGRPRTDLAAVDAAGAATAWDPSAGGDVLALAPLEHGVAAGGWFSAVNGVMRRNLAALGEDGRPTDWNPDADAGVSKLALAGDTVYAGGQCLHAGGAARAHLAALSATTGAATAFDPRPSGDVYDLALSPDGGTLYVAGSFATIGQSGPADRPNLAAVSAGSGDPSAWRPAPDLWVGHLAPAPDGSAMYVSGVFKHIGSQTPQPARGGLAALTLDTGTATDWNVSAQGGVYALLPLPAGVYLAGAFTKLNDQVRSAAGAVGYDGAVLPFDPHTKSNDAAVLARTASGTILLGGSYFGLGGSDRRALAEVDAATGAVLPWNPRPTSAVNMIAVAGRHVWIGGDGAIGSVPDQGLARFTRPADPAPATPSGPVPGSTPAPGARDTTAPALSALSLSHKRFRRGGKGTTLRLTLSEPATVRIAIERRRGRRYVAFTIAGAPRHRAPSSLRR